MTDMDERYRKLLKGKSIPILILDNRWHQLFQIERKSSQVKKLERELKRLLKKQGKAGRETKAAAKVKLSIAKDISEHMSDENSEDVKLSRKQIKRQEAFDKVEHQERKWRQELTDLPHRIEIMNLRLMMETMEICYLRLRYNDRVIAETKAWIEETARKLREAEVEKDNRISYNNQMYSYLHDMLGSDVVEIFDEKYRNKVSN